jgi:hypothetical protein
MKGFTIVAVLVAAGWWSYARTAEKPWEPPPAFQAEMDRAGREAKTDFNGSKGDEAARICRRIAGVTVPAKTAKDVIAAGYGSETAIKFVDCIVNYMYPVDAKKAEELDRKAGAR